MNAGVYQVEHVYYKAEEVLNLSGGIYADPEYADILNFLAQNEWHFEHHATGPGGHQGSI
jgi:hypothetical protein